MFRTYQGKSVSPQKVTPITNDIIFNEDACLDDDFKTKVSQSNHVKNNYFDSTIEKKDNNFHQTQVDFGKFLSPNPSPNHTAKYAGLGLTLSPKFSPRVVKVSSPTTSRHQVSGHVDAFRGSLNPQHWRASYDTNEITDIIKMQKESSGKNHNIRTPRAPESLDQSDHFRTSNQGFFTEKLEANQREFGADEQRKLRYALEICTPTLIKKDKGFIQAIGQLQRQRTQYQQSHVSLKDKVMRENASAGVSPT